MIRDMTQGHNCLKLHFAQRFDGVKHTQNGFFKVLFDATNSDASNAKKTGRIFRREVTRKRCAKFEGAPTDHMYGRYVWLEAGGWRAEFEIEDAISAASQIFRFWRNE